MSTWPGSTDHKGCNVQAKDVRKRLSEDFNRCFTCGSAPAWVEFAIPKSPKPMLVNA